MLQHRNKGVFFYTQIRQFNKQYFRKEGLFDMRKIVTRKACFELEADGFSIHTFEISRKLTKSECITVKRSCTIRIRFLPRFAFIKSRKMYIGYRSMKQMVCALPWSTHTIRRTVAAIMYAWWLILAKSLIQMRPTLVFSHPKSPVSSSYKRRFIHF